MIPGPVKTRETYTQLSKTGVLWTRQVRWCYWRSDPDLLRHGMVSLSWGWTRRPERELVICMTVNDKVKEKLVDVRTSFCLSVFL